MSLPTSEGQEIHVFQMNKPNETIKNTMQPIIQPKKDVFSTLSVNLAGNSFHLHPILN